MLEPLPAPTDIPAAASYHWTPTLQADFLGHLAAQASVRGAAASVQMSPRAAYDLRQRRDGLAFKLGWAAAILIARDRLQDELLDRAMTGTEDVYERVPLGEAGAFQVRRRRINANASMAMLDRLDGIIAERAATPEDRLARIIAADFAAYLDLFTTAAFAADPDAALTAWFTEQQGRPDPLAALVEASAKACEVSQFSAIADDDDCPIAAAADLCVWHDEDEGEWLTNFPPADDDFLGREEGDIGFENYWRTLDDQETAAMNAGHVVVPLTWDKRFRIAAAARRQEFFGLDRVGAAA